MRQFITVRYSVAFVALLLAFLLSVQFSERGFVFEPRPSSALAAAETEGEYSLRNPRVLSSVLLYVRDSYVDPERIDPHRMLAHALDGVQSAVPEVVALFDRDIDDRPTQVEVRVGATSRTFVLDDTERLWSMWAQLRQIFEFIEDNVTPGETDMPEVEYAAVNGLLRTLDPHSVLLRPRIYAEMQASNRGSFGGLGIVVSIRDGDLTVISPIDNTPASRAGFRPGDRITKINDESTINMPLDEAVSRLRGDPGTTVVVEIDRDEWQEPHQFTLEREIINVESVRHHALGNGIGYVAITNFQQQTGRDLRAALNSLREESEGLRGLVLDLRNNPGGLLTQAIAVADTFLDQGAIVTTVAYGARVREENVANARNTEPRYPIIVLVNEGSASASEIVAGALKAHNRALVLGDRTFGKGSVQLMHELRDRSALKLTIAEYLTPGDVSIQGHGIVPDIEVIPVSVSDDVVDLYPSERTSREDAFDAWNAEERRTNGDERPSLALKFLQERTERDAEPTLGEEEFTVDFLIDTARQLLLASEGAYERGTLLGRVSSVVSRIGDEQMLEVRELLRQRNVDWSSGDNVIQPVRLEARLERPTSGTIRAGDEAIMRVDVTNEGDRALYRVRAVSRSDYRAFDDREFVFGRLGPGESATWSVRVKIPEEDMSRIERVDFRAFADEIDLESATALHVQVAGEVRPHWGFSYTIEGAEDAGRLHVGDTVNLQVRVRNTGEGDARKTLVHVRNRSDAALFLRTGRAEFESIRTGDEVEARFEFDVRERPESGEITVTVEIFDTVFREYVTEDLHLPIFEQDEETRVRERPGTFVAGSEGAALRSGSWEESDVSANAAAGARLPVDRFHDGWYRVQYVEGRHAWVADAEGSFETAEAALQGEVTERLQFHAPRIRITDAPLRTDDAYLSLRGHIEGDRDVRDFYVNVFTRPDRVRRPQATKRAYQYLGAREASFEERVALQPGMNRISVVARDSDNLTSTQTIFVYRNAP